MGDLKGFGKGPGRNGTGVSSSSSHSHESQPPDGTLLDPDPLTGPRGYG